MFLVSTAEMRELDRRVQDRGVPALILMENAGKIWPIMPAVFWGSRQ